MAGAFGSARTGRPQDMAGRPPQDARMAPGRPQDAPSPTLDGLQAKLAQLTGGAGDLPILGGQDAPGRPDSREQGGPGGGSLSSAMQSLQAIAAARTARTAGRGAGQDAQDGKPKTAPKGEFVPGQRPTPTGPTAHEILRTPEHKDALKQVVAEWEGANPGRVLKATHLVSLWNAKNPGKPLNEARARTVVAKLNKIRDQHAEAQVRAFMRMGAKKAMA